MVAMTQITQSTISSVASSPGMDVRQISPGPQKIVASAPQAQVRDERVISEREVRQAVEQANRELENIGPSETIGFGYVEKLNQIYVQIKDSKSGEVIHEIPSKDFIKYKLAMQEMIGLILDKKA